MTERYDEAAAAHYSAYRPPLHDMILARVLDQGAYIVGLDVGCGTGYSAVALARYCERVFAIDPSPAMLSKAKPDEKVTYLSGAGERIPLADASMDIVTLAGSLPYVDAVATRAEIGRVGRVGALVLVYDFEVLLNEILLRCGVDPGLESSEYDHRAAFEEDAGLTKLLVSTERVTVEVTGAQLAHVLLSDSNRLDQLAERYGEADPFAALARELEAAEHSAIEADVYYSLYRLVEP